ncbi:MAG: hypothetical protein LVQ95_02145 [Candidatus Micrarchaeales archaeon]|nr:hypothetical protein [Candidatus Micrarchaeales archaeon]
MDQEQLVMPGDKIGVEEEYIAADNTFVDDDGTIRSAIIGKAVISEGRISVVNERRDVRKFKRGMFVVGTVTDDVKSVMFVKIDNVSVDGKEYIAIKDGKIVAQTRRPPGRFDRGGGREGHGERGPPPAKAEKQAGVGDVILAKILYEDPEIFTLTLNDNEAGVIYSDCGLCGNEMRADGTAALVCDNCKNRVNRKVSPLYDNPEGIKRLFVQA